MKVLITQSCLTLCDPTNCSPPGFSVHGILEARILQWIAILFSRGSNHGLLHCRQILYLRATGKSKILLVVTSIVRAQSLQTSPTLCNRMDWSLPGSSVHGIFQARILEWVAMSSSRGSSRRRYPTRVSSGSPALQAGSPGKPIHQKSHVLYQPDPNQLLCKR